MIVQGGSYAVRVAIPNRYDPLAGSGTRAAQSLASLKPTLVTAAHADSVADLNEMFGSNLYIAERDRPIEFRYFTPMDRPDVTGRDAVVAIPTSPRETDVALTFGMIERDQIPRPLAETHVIDVQNPRDPNIEDVLPAGPCRVVLCVNRTEVRKLTGLTDAATAAAQLLGTAAVEGVIVKNGALGAVVHTNAGQTQIGVRPTRRVWPIGSGDVFSAGVAGSLALGADVVEAARVGSVSAALWCGSDLAEIPLRVLKGESIEQELADPELVARADAPLIYLAAPFFTLAERWLVEYVRSQLLGMGVRVFSPLHDVGKGGDEVASADLQGLRESDAVLALLDGWDPGTIYETGWAHRHGLPVIGLLSVAANEEDKMLVGSGAEIHRDITSALYRTVWVGSGGPLHAGRYS